MTCYSYHSYHDTLGNFPTMKERVDELRASGAMKLADELRARHRAEAQARSAAVHRKARLAERVELNGRLIHPGNTHGRINTYTALGCRGSMCYAAWRHYSTTGEGRLPEAVSELFSAEDCALHVSARYPDNRR